MAVIIQATSPRCTTGAAVLAALQGAGVDAFGIEVGDKLLVFGDLRHGLALARAEEIDVAGFVRLANSL